MRAIRKNTGSVSAGDIGWGRDTVTDVTCADFTVLRGFSFTNDNIELGAEVVVENGTSTVSGVLLSAACLSGTDTDIYVKVSTSDLSSLGTGTYSVKQSETLVGTIVYDDGDFGDFTAASPTPVVPTTQPNDEIWYVTSDSKVVAPVYIMDNSEEAELGVGEGEEQFGVNIVSNTYANGKGIIKFSGNVTKIKAQFQSIKITALSIPETATEIGSAAFTQTEITEFTIPSSVTEIEQFILPGTIEELTLSQPYENSIFYYSGNVNAKVYVNLSSVSDEYSISLMLPYGGVKGLKTYEVYTDLESLKEQALDMNDDYTSVTVKHLDGTAWA